MKNLYKAVQDYLCMRRQLGFKLNTTEIVLKGFAAYAEQKKASYITSDLALEFAMKNRQSSRVRWAVKLGIIRRFALHLRMIDPRTQVPTPDLLPYTYQRRPPYIYSSSDIIKLLDSCENLPTNNPLRAQTYYTLFGLISVTGMRIGEALALDCESVDLALGIITIRESKFRKSRKIPIHASTIKSLARYSKKRVRYYGEQKSSYFFVNNFGAGLEASTVHKVFVKACVAAGLRKKGIPGGPKIISFRHTFVVRTLLRCYQEGLNPDVVIPTLSTYLGHENPVNTYWYLTATPELLSLINKQPEKKVGGE